MKRAQYRHRDVKVTEYKMSRSREVNQVIQIAEVRMRVRGMETK